MKPEEDIAADIGTQDKPSDAVESTRRSQAMLMMRSKFKNKRHGCRSELSSSTCMTGADKQTNRLFAVVENVGACWIFDFTRERGTNQIGDLDV